MTRPVSSVAVVGPGAIGLTFAAAAEQAGHDVVICGRRPLDGRPTVELSDGRRIDVDAPVVTQPKDARAVADVVLLAVKAHQTEGAAHIGSELSAAPERRWWCFRTASSTSRWSSRS